MAIARLTIFLLFLAACFLGGGGSRDDILSLLYVRPMAVICLVACLALPGRIDFDAIRVPFWLLVGLTLLTALQLVPLPPGLWTALPGREVFARGAEIVGVPQPWRPISLAPDLTLNSLAAMTVPFAALIGFASLASGHRYLLLPVLLGAVAISVLVGVLQLAGEPGGAFYLYRITNINSAVGLFANRNHQALLLAMAFPMLALWAAQPSHKDGARLPKGMIALLLAPVLVVMILVTGSRGGLVFGGIAAIWAGFIYLELRRLRVGGGTARGKSFFLALIVTIVVGALIAYVAFSRAETLHRFAGEQVQEEQRLVFLPYLIDMARDFFPVGSGLGTFDPVFRVREPFHLLVPGYLNHAHDDALELVITGGLPAVLLLLVFLFWIARQSIAAFRPGREWVAGLAFAQLGAVLISLLLLASFVDYPLRTPVFAAVLAIACGWLGQSRAKSRHGKTA